MTDRVLSSWAHGCRLEEATPPGETVLLGRPTARISTLTRLGDVEAGLWEMSPGQVADTEADEVFVVLSGRGRLIVDGDGDAIDLHAGVVVQLRAGDRTHWQVDETLRKFYVSRVGEDSAP